MTVFFASIAISHFIELMKISSRVFFCHSGPQLDERAEDFNVHRLLYCRCVLGVFWEILSSQILYSLFCNSAIAGLVKGSLIPRWTVLNASGCADRGPPLHRCFLSFSSFLRSEVREISPISNLIYLPPAPLPIIVVDVSSVPLTLILDHLGMRLSPVFSPNPRPAATLPELPEPRRGRAADVRGHRREGRPPQLPRVHGVPPGPP